MNFENTIEFARQCDARDPLREYRERFHYPRDRHGNEHVYLCGNSLGLQPKSVRSFVEQELLDWEKLGVEGHFHAKNPWMPYHEFLTNSSAKLVGAKGIEVVVMNTLSVNLHLMMASFYRPQGKRNKILIENDAFPSDIYAVEAQIRWHGLDPTECLIRLKPAEGEYCVDDALVIQTIEENKDELALVMLGAVNYYTGQLFDMKSITAAAHMVGAKVGFDLAHAAGNVPLQLHDSGMDFACWCTYKYLNSGPGSLSGCFVHERHANDKELVRLAGWWGHNKTNRFEMRHAFDPIPGAEGWQLSNPPILPLAAMRASLEIFDEVGMIALRNKSLKLTGFLEFLLSGRSDLGIEIITPKTEVRRGCQLSIVVKGSDKSVFNAITEEGVIADWREPDVIRVAPVPLYNSFEDVFKFSEILIGTLETTNA